MVINLRKKRKLYERGNDVIDDNKNTIHKNKTVKINGKRNKIKKIPNRNRYVYHIVLHIKDINDMMKNNDVTGSSN